MLSLNEMLFLVSFDRVKLVTWKTTQFNIDSFSCNENNFSNKNTKYLFLSNILTYCKANNCTAL